MSASRIRLTALALGLAASLLAMAVQLAGALRPVEDVATDLLMRARGKARPDPRVVVCDVDAASVKRFGRWPWPRTRVGELIDRLAAGGARVIALDMVFSEPSRADPLCNLTAEDGALARSLARAGNVVLGFFFRSRALSEGSEGTRPAAPAVPAALAGARIERVIEPPGGFAIPRRPAVEPNLEVFARAAESQGFFSHERESGVLRHYHLLVRYGDSYFPALALRAVQRFRAAGPLALAPGRDNLPEISLAGSRIEADEAGALWVNYRGPARTFATIPALQVLAGAVPPGALRDRLVFVGASEAGIADVQATPFGGEIAGVEVHANVADNLLARRFIRDSGLQVGVSLLALLLLGPAVALLAVAVERHLYGPLLAIALVLLWPLACFQAFARSGWHLQVVSPALAGVAALVAGLRYRLGYVEKRARQIKRTFQRYVSEAVVEEMLRHPERVKLGGERRELTVLFSDIRGFTSLSETLDSEALVELLNEFFTPMTRIVLAHGGTLDKYMGDALMAFFGAPLAQPDHSPRACRAALAMRDELARLNAGWRQRGKLPPGKALGIGIGLNSGEMSVGNIGSEAVFGYTVIGDNVNLGSRIEGLNKLYGTALLVSEHTAKAAVAAAPAGNGLLLRELDRVLVKGKHVPVAIYEVVAELPAAAADRERVEGFARGLAAYRGRDFAAAAAIFGDLAERLGDAPAAVFRERCRHLLAEPPPEGWDAVEVLTEK
ncbi:MAG TPA: adenylate/guanylate cyclase domain-containing protein [Thermoanaerobaculia bacterium]|nr:adenylate/guanylate cyclase domain-containing protein [Thermoanaerobaculia bacterium]